MTRTPMRVTSAFTLRIQPGRSRSTLRPDSDSVLSMMYRATAAPPHCCARTAVGSISCAKQETTTMTTHALRSRNWFGPRTLDGLMHRAYLRAEGFSDLVFDGRPVIGIANSWSELTHCNAHLRQVAEAVKRGVWSAGGFPLEFPTISLGEILMKPTAMLFRNLMAMDVEECLRAYPLDAVVLLSGCDKTTPAMLMGAASADVPAIMVTGGPMLRGKWRTEELGSGTDAWRLWSERRAGRMSDEELCEAESCMSRSSGHCMVMGTASTMASMAEALGMTLPGNAAIPAPDSRRLALAELSGRRASALRDPDGESLRQRDPRRHGDRRLDQRDHPPGRPRRARRRPAAAHPLRRAVALDTLPRQRETLGEVPHGGLLLRRRPPRGPQGAHAPAPRRRADGERPAHGGQRPGRSVLERGRHPAARDAPREGRRHGRPVGQPVSRRRLAQAVGRLAASPHPSGPRRRLRGPRRPPPPHRRPRTADRRELGARAQARRAEGGARDAGMGRRTDPRAAPEARREGHGQDFGRPHERHLLWHGRPPRRAGIGGRRAPGARP